VKTKEPAQAWVWVTIAVLLFLCVPYFFAGTYEPLVFGIPLWFLTALAASLGLTGFTVYVILRRWRLAAAVLGEEED
jgi:hypothetical protein